MASPGAGAGAVYYNTLTQPTSTLTFYFPSGYSLQSTLGGDVLVLTNSASAKISITQGALLASPTPSFISSMASATSSPISSTPPLTTSGSTSTTSSLSASSLDPGSTQYSSITSIISKSTGSHQTTSTSPPPSSTSHASHNNRLPNGTVAGIVAGAAVGLALLTFAATYLFMRRRKSSKNRDSLYEQSQYTESKGPSVLEKPKPSDLFETYLPQSADDRTVQNTAKTIFDQIELHVENFYQNTSRMSTQPTEADVKTFNSPYLSGSLGALLAQSRNAVPLIKHSLAHFVTDSISLIANPETTLLPDEFVLLPSTVKGANTRTSLKPGFAQSMSRWRLLTAYLLPSPSQDPAYIAERDRRIAEIVQTFSRAFAPWQNPKYKDSDRVRSLSATLKDAADLGLFLFTQPSELQFQWSRQSDVGPNKVAITPSLVKLTDEKGNILKEPQIMLNTTTQKA